MILTTERTEFVKEKYEYIIEILKTAGLFIGGIAVFINIYFAAKRAYAMEESAIAANKNAEIALHNLKISEDKQITERFAKAIEQLASEKIEVRLGAIYTLERIARDSEQDQWTIMEVLTAFVREYAPVKKEDKLKGQEDIEKLPKLRLDIQACLTVIGERIHPDPEKKRLNLTNVDISNANLIGANLTGADIIEANLTGADFTGADLTGAFLIGACLTGACLTGAYLIGAYLTGADIIEAKLIKADLTGANLVAAKLTKSILKQANLTGAYLKEADLTGAYLKEVNLTGAYLFRANLTQANLTKSILKGANLVQAYLAEADLAEADLTGAILKGAIMPDGSIHD
ncbi:pentapeptide repeat-containing protein [Anabaena sphaerica]|nr:pentapeptide repeat-containing protein [Anabaena sphaerica]